MEATQTLHVESSSVTLEPPDTIRLVLSGCVDGAIADELIEQLVQWAANMPYVLVIMNVTDLSSLSTEARKILTSNGHRMPARALASCGGSFSIRVALDLMDRASWLLGSRNRYAKHWPDEKSARAWASEMRFVLSENAK